MPVVVGSVAGLLLSFQLGWAQDDVPPVAPEPPTVPDTHEAVWKNLDHKIPVAPSLGLAYAISPIQKTMGIGEERGRPVYENAAKVLREAASKDFRFRQAKLADVVNYLVVEAGIDYVSDLDSQAAGEKFVSFSVTNVSPFRALENLTKHFKLALTFDGILWHVTALDRSPRTEGAEVSEPTLFGPKASVPWSEELRLSGSSADLPVSLFNESDAERKMGEVLPPVLEQPSSAPATIRRSLSLPVEAPRLDVLELPKPQPARVKPVPRIAEPMEPAKPVAPVDVER